MGSSGDFDCVRGIEMITIAYQVEHLDAKGTILAVDGPQTLTAGVGDEIAATVNQYPSVASVRVRFKVTGVVMVNTHKPMDVVESRSVWDELDAMHERTGEYIANGGLDGEPPAVQQIIKDAIERQRKGTGEDDGEAFAKWVNERNKKLGLSPRDEMS